MLAILVVIFVIAFGLTLWSVLRDYGARGRYKHTHVPKPRHGTIMRSHDRVR